MKSALFSHFIFNHDPRDISAIYFYEPDLKQYSRLLYRDSRRPLKSVWELREVRSQLEKEGRKEIDESAIFEAYERMRRLEETAVKETKRARRNKQCRVMNSRATKPMLDNGDSTADADLKQLEDQQGITTYDKIKTP
jgi:putative transposase